ncbi:MAG: ATP-binding protein [Gemmobacter sp.]|jgi:hypothetical protein|nr:ATP-binding protein [Gemmobacter sp.]
MATRHLSQIELAARWNISHRTLERWRWTDEGPNFIKLGGRVIKRFDSPEHEPYDRCVIKLQTRASALLQEHSDVVLFANYQISVAKSDVGFNKKVTRALGSGARVMHTEERPAFLAKNRYGLPDTLPLMWSEFLAAMPQSQ